jgi:hypothetical protein
MFIDAMRNGAALRQEGQVDLGVMPVPVTVDMALLTGVCREKVMDTRRRMSKLWPWEKDFEHTT